MLRRTELCLPDSIEVDEISLHLDAGNRSPQVGGSALQFALVMDRFRCRVSAEPSGKTTVGAAIGVEHEDHAPCPMQPHGLADLLQHEFAVGFKFWRGHALGTASDFDGIGIYDADPLQELSESELKTVVKAP